ncbi:hypothetical protein [Agromyces aerolatus]|uniref:hypothetical protein n=1 Tax=Agromyces sp. LY-1074 TaxID=3074080 RepID=UPI002856E1C5|nr:MULTISPECIES: hypothetical protein [unclassified Agromyces]MDR5699654.1 hypothetical protein [Agromyces sp. LY-1074]MDR5705950.1 hypothetical protein [Agromyces sp. LY-1358]
MRKIMMGTCLTFGLLAMAVPTAATAAPEAPTFEAPAASTDSYDSYTEKVFRELVEWTPFAWSGKCRDGYWLDRRVGTDGRGVGHGFEVSSDAPHSLVSVLEYPWRRVKDGPYVQGSGGDAVNIVPVLGEWIDIKMTCTNDPAFAWVD